MHANVLFFSHLKSKKSEIFLELLQFVQSKISRYRERRFKRWDTNLSAFLSVRMTRMVRDFLKPNWNGPV